MIKSFMTRLGVAAVFSVASLSAAQAATLVDAQLVDLYSATFDGPLTPDAGLFFGGDPSLNPRNIVVTPMGTGSGTILYDGTTLSQLNIILPQMQLVINGTTTVLTNGVDITLDITTPATDTEAGFVGFQVEGAPATIADFATFTTIVTHTDPLQCYDTLAGPGTIGGLCGLIPVLSLDGVRYELFGSIAGNDLKLAVQTGNNSIYEVDLTVAAVPVPAAVWLFGSALGLLGWMRRRVA